MCTVPSPVFSCTQLNGLIGLIDMSEEVGPSEEQIESLRRAFRRPVVGTILEIIARTEKAMQVEEEVEEEVPMEKVEEEVPEGELLETEEEVPEEKVEAEVPPEEVPEVEVTDETVLTGSYSYDQYLHYFQRKAEEEEPILATEA